MLRSNSRPRLRLAAAGLALCAGLATAGPALAARSAPAGHLAPVTAAHGPTTFVVGNTDAVDTLNPFNGFTSQDFEVYGLIYDNLMDYGQLDYSGAPRLATSWSHSKDGLTWTYHIRKGVKWSDGVPLTAADVAYTFQRNIQPNSTEFADNEAYVGQITSAVATGPYTVVMKVRHYSPVMNRLIVPILPEHIWKNVSEKQLASFANNNPVGSGPFIVSSFSANQSITLKANPGYWGGKPGIKTLVFQRFDNPTAEKLALANGSIDFAEDLTPALWQSLKGTPGVKLINAPAGNFDELAFNNGAATVDNKPIGNGNPALTDINVRHAISYAINTSELVKKVLLGTGSPGTSVIPPIYAQFHYTPPASATYHYDPARASAILTADGWKLGPNGIRVKDGKQLTLRLFVRNQSPEQEQDAPYIVGWLKAVGIGVTTTSMSDSQLTADIGNGQYDMFMWGWGVEPNPDFQLSTFTCGQRSTGSAPNYTPGWSDSFYCDPAYDKLYSQQQGLDGAARAAVVKQMQQMLYLDDNYSLLYYWNDTQAYRSDLFTGFAPQPNQPNGLYLYQEVSWWSYRCIRPAGTSPSLTEHNIGCEHEIGAVTAATTSGVNGGLIGGIVAAVIVVALAGVLIARRRKTATADERE
ncbi:MAG TPA: ABC transporter substrate-binding protein [Streptosporangiaceae bacterium]|nr:ABC transporter substrate-binding protein [Streptosporangiaceae bacterium]